ncbi:hypothetical protein EV196_108222 [Mariniflexile fucanivorans]|uniref:Outer membrane protein with beta-barrel domain n=1 Tax=Mariniflexile fucanivorans TaxID=264023 RepID=A0A4R1RDR6_9FLAO|nr:hypothetical protein [Mariniflexile fucanivorans]TCL64024.1 hypothetical protein EV196_108222 [Mariniflexile fucanivorans]
MKIKTTILLIITLHNLVVAQQNEENNNIKVVEDNEVKSESNYYKAYFSEIKINSNLTFQQERNIRVESDYTVFEFPLLLKYNITKKVSLLAGPKIDLYTDKFGLTGGPVVNLTVGIDYEVNDSFLMEARFNFRPHDDIPIQTDYTFGSNTFMTLGSKFRF